MSEIDDVVDMGEVSVEDPVKSLDTSAASTIPAKRGRKPKDPNAPKAPKVEKAPAEPKSPIVGEYKELPNFEINFVDGWEDKWNDATSNLSKHHQRQLIVDIYREFGDPLSAAKIVTAIEGNPEYLARMKTNQSVMKCVLYHLDHMEKQGVILTTRVKRTRKPKEETPTTTESLEGSTEPIPDTLG